MIVYVGSIPYFVEDGIIHSGILKMKWGQRRYRNYDGTLTEEGKIRYGRAAGKGTKRKGHPIKSMSDEDLAAASKRIQAENTYLKAVSENKKLTEATWKKNVRSGTAAVSKLVSGIVTMAVGEVLKASSKTIASTGKAFMKDLFAEDKVEQPKKTSSAFELYQLRKRENAFLSRRNSDDDNAHMKEDSSEFSRRISTGDKADNDYDKSPSSDKNNFKYRRHPLARR